MNYRDELYHYGLKGMKWGTRRWQNEDGTFNEAGKTRYFGQNSNHHLNNFSKSQNKSASAKSIGQKMTVSNTEKKGLSDKQKKVLKTAAIVAGTALAAYGAYKVTNLALDKNHEKQMDAARQYIRDMNKMNAPLERFYRETGNFKAYDASRNRSYEIEEAVYNSISNRRSKFDPKKIDAQIRKADHAKANQELIRKMMDEGMKNGGVRGTYNFSDMGYNNLGFDLRKKR